MNRIDPPDEEIQNEVLQPHQGSVTHDIRATMGSLVIDNLWAYLAGKLLLRGCCPVLPITRILARVNYDRSNA